MTNKQIMTITGYFDKKGMDRKQLEAVLDFDNLTMDEKYIPEIMELLKSGDDEVGENIIRNYVRFVKDRSGSGDITWDDFLKQLDKLYLEDSEFGIRVQRFSKETYWEVFFDHFDIKDCEDGKAMVTFNHYYYEDTENDNAYDTFEKYGFNIDFDADDNRNEIISQIGDRWSQLSDDGKEEVANAISAWFATHYVDKSRMNISNESIERIWMSNADLVPQMGLRDYNITFTNGEMVCLRF